MRKFDLEDRLNSFTCSIINIVESLPNTRAGNYIVGQLIRSGHSPAFNYGEVQAAESRADFIHKLGICMKELKECRIAFKIIIKNQLIKPVSTLQDTYNETEELIAIIAKSIETARRKKTDTKN